MTPTPFPALDMLEQSIRIFGKPNKSSFEYLKESETATLRNALIYMAGMAVVIGIIAAFTRNFSTFFSETILTFVGFIAFTYVSHWISRIQGEDNLAKLAYAFSLFWGPITIIAALTTVFFLSTIIGVILATLITILGFVAKVYLAYVAIQALTNLSEQKILLRIVATAAIGSVLAERFVNNILNQI